MAGDSGTYVLAVRREARHKAPANWQNLVRKLSGDSGGSDDSPERIQIEADAEAIERVRAALGDVLNIEPILLRGTQGKQLTGG